MRYRRLNAKMTAAERAARSWFAPVGMLRTPAAVATFLGLLLSTLVVAIFVAVRQGDGSTPPSTRGDEWLLPTLLLTSGIAGLGAMVYKTWVWPGPASRLVYGVLLGTMTVAMLVFLVAAGVGWGSGGSQGVQTTGDVALLFLGVTVTLVVVTAVCSVYVRSRVVRTE